MALKTLFILLISSFLLYGQSYIFRESIGNFKDASSFSISSLGFIYVSDAVTNEVLKLDFKGNILKDIGGYGWENAQFDQPVDVFSSPLNVYVADKNNNRIQVFDKDLNLVRVFKSNPVNYSEPVFAYPISVSISDQGDLFILDSDNRTIHKYDINGEFIRTFGGIDAGELTISDPRDLFLDGNKAVYILDGSHIINIFDTFGNSLGITKLEPEIISINGLNRTITLTATNEIFTLDSVEPGLPAYKLNLLETPDNSLFLSSVIFDSNLYILTSTKILVYNSIP